MDTIYLIFINADSTEGRGPMIPATDYGFFTSEEEAYKVADIIPGVMGRKPEKSWKHSTMGDVEVRKFMKDNGEKYKKIKFLEKEITKLQQELFLIKNQK